MLSGTNFGPTDTSPSMSIGLTQCTVNIWITTTSMLCVLPAGTGAGAVVTVRLASLTGTLARGLTYDGTTAVRRAACSAMIVVAVRSSCLDVSWDCERAHHRRLDAHGVWHELRGSRHVSNDFDWRSTVHHKQLDVSDLDGVPADGGWRRAGNGHRDCGISDQHVSCVLVHIRQCACSCFCSGEPI